VVTTSRTTRPAVAGSVLAVALAATSIGALLADLYGLTSIATFARWLTLPAMIGLVVLGSIRRPELGEVQRRIRVGAVGGIAGIIGYDLVRIPFAAAGMRVFAPIDSYGLLILNGHMASPWSNTVGWLFHLSNGITFGIMYAVVAARRHWGWGVLWGVTLETFVIVSPFVERYALAGQATQITLAYGAHVAFGYPLGRVVQRLDRTDEELRALLPRPTTAAVVVSILFMLVWHHPWTMSPARREAGRVSSAAGQPALVVQRDRFSPEWLRVRSGGCIVVVNHSATTYTTPFGNAPASGQGRLCFTSSSVDVRRVKLGDQPYSGGFVVVDGR